MQNEPTAEWQSNIHQQIVNGDPLAFAELCEAALPHVIVFLAQQFFQHDQHAIESVAIDLLLSYQGNPQQYNPKKLSLFAYLRMAAKYDMLTSIKARDNYNGRLVSIDALEGAGEPAAQSIEQLMVDDVYPLPAIMALVEDEFDATERRVLNLMLGGVRETEQYAQVLGIADQNVGVQRREVKRIKDRISKRLRRMGKKLNA